MDKNEYLKFISDYKSKNSGFCAVHDSHDKEIVTKIQNNGLCVSHNPYGRKIRHSIDENGKIDLDKVYMATFVELSENDSWIGSVPVAPIFLNIPQVLIDKMREVQGSSFDEVNFYKHFCGFGFQSVNENGGRGEIAPVKNRENANIRLLPSYLVDGYLDIETGKFIENPNAFRSLSKEIQDKIMELIENGKASELTCKQAYYGEPIVERVSLDEIQEIQEELFEEKPKILIEKIKNDSKTEQTNIK